MRVDEIAVDEVVNRGRECIAGLDLTDAIVVVGLGGGIGLRWAVENADRVAALAIFDTGLFTGRVSKRFMAWRDFAERNPDLPVGFVIRGATEQVRIEGASDFLQEDRGERLAEEVLKHLI